MKKFLKKNNTKRNTKKNNTKRNTKKNNTKRNTKKNNTKRNTKKIYKRKMNGGGDGEEEERERREREEQQKKIWENLNPEQKLLSNQKVRIQIQFEKKKIEGKATINVTYENKKFILKIKLDMIPSVYDLKSSITYMPSSPHIYTEYNYKISDDGLRILKNGVDKFTGFDDVEFPNYYEKKNCTLPDLSEIILNFDKFIEIDKLKDKLKKILIKRILTEKQRKDEERTKNKVRELHMKKANLTQLVSISQAN
jgi:hypothetical protein